MINFQIIKKIVVGNREIDFVMVKICERILFYFVVVFLLIVEMV